MPALAVLVPFIMTLISRFLLIKAVMWVISIMAFLGIAFATNELLVAPLINLIDQAMGSLSTDISQWAGYLGVDRCISIIISAYSLREAKHVFLRKA